MKNRIIFFTRVPKVGTTKTRLYDFVSPNTAVEIQKKLMKKNYNILKRNLQINKIIDDSDYTQLLVILLIFYYNIPKYIK